MPDTAGRFERPPAALGLLLGLLLVAAACGGGGSGGSDVPGDPEPVTFSVSGSIPAANGTAVDSDVNDTSAPFAPNDLIAEAQEIPNPVILGGYVNEPGEGPVGRSSSAGDVIDLFRVALAQGQVIRLAIAADPTYFSDPNLDLRLLQIDGTQVAASQSSSSLSEEVIVPSTDSFLVEVSVLDGAANYVLSIGQAPAAARAAEPGASPIPQPEFVPGEIIVRFADAAFGVSSVAAPAARAAALGMRHLADSSHGEVLVSCRDDREREQAFRTLGIGHLRTGDPAIGALDAEERLRQDTRRLVKALRLRADVATADLNYIRRPTAVPADAFFPFQWHYEQINLPEAWDAVSPDSGVIVAVVDTGILSAHPDLSGQLLPGYDFILETAVSADSDGCDTDPEDPGDGATPGGSSFHGTHVAGIVAARTSLQAAGNTEGVAGVAWNARIMPLRVLGVGGGTDFDIMQAILYAAGRDNDCGVLPAEPAHVVNMSLGGPGFSTGFRDLVLDVRDDLVLVAAAGNSASSLPFYPAAYDGVISVSAVGPAKELAPYSNFGSTIAVAAPGGDFSGDVDGDGFLDGVLSTLFDATTDNFIYTFSQGTSMASPHVAGVIALMLGVNPGLGPSDIDNLLALGAITEDLGNPGFFGAGLIDAVQAVNAAAEATGGEPPLLLPVLRVDPDALNFGVLADQFVLSATNGGGDGTPLDVEGVSFTSDAGGAWLTVTELVVDPGTGLGTYRVDLDRGGLVDGLYTGTIHFDSNANDVDIPVIMQVGDAVAGQPDAGHQFVLLVAPGNTISEAAVGADAVDGVYSFTFQNVDPGDYLVVTGTDADNDFFICDPGEACGAYPTLDTILPVSVDRDLSGIDFLTGFTPSVGASAAGVEAAVARRGFSRAVERRLAR